MEQRLNMMTVIAKGLLLGLIVLAGVRIVQNVTDALIAVEQLGRMVVEHLC